MDSREQLEARQFQRSLEKEIEHFRRACIPGGFLIPDRLDREMVLVKRAQSIAAHHAITTEQACFALVSALNRLDSPPPRKSRGQVKIMGEKAGR